MIWWMDGFGQHEEKSLFVLLDESVQLCTDTFDTKFRVMRGRGLVYYVF
jgi:hypothetical protein